MFDDLKEFVMFTLVAAAALAFTLTVVLTPITYFEGIVKSDLLEQRGITMPWYKAAFVPDTMFNAGNVSIKVEGVK